MILPGPAIDAAFDDVYARLDRLERQAPSGLTVPLYAIANADALITARLKQPTVPVMATVNPASGPGTVPDVRFTAAIPRLQDAGILVKMYIPTKYGSAVAGYTLADLYLMIDRAFAFYPTLDGFHFDEQAPGMLKRPFYQALTLYARSKGARLINGNPGNQVSEGVMPLWDVEDVCESDTMISYDQARLCTFASTKRYSKHRFAAVIKGQQTPDLAGIKMLSSLIGWWYVTNDGQTNPYDTLPPYLDQLLETLAAT